MPDLSVIVCTHNPRSDFLRRTIASLRAQTMTADRWELLIVDNASATPVTATCDLSWHPRGRHVREETLGLTPARLRGIRESTGDMLVFADDDNLLAPDYLERVVAIGERHPYVAVFGAGRLEPEFEIDPPRELRPYLALLALRTVDVARWSNNPIDYHTIPWGAGLCVRRGVADGYAAFVQRLDATATLDRKGDTLFSGGDDLFSWVAASSGSAFGIFPDLRITHLIAASRLTRAYVLRLLEGHAQSHGLLAYRLSGLHPRRLDGSRHIHALLRGIRHGLFAMRCTIAQYRGEDRAARDIAARGLQPLKENR